MTQPARRLGEPGSMTAGNGSVEEARTLKEESRGLYLTWGAASQKRVRGSSPRRPTCKIKYLADQGPAG
jgi:hypothetical protein